MNGEMSESFNHCWHFFPAKCGPVPSLANSEVVWHNRSVVIHRCEAGFHSWRGTNVSLCGSSGVWQEATLKCTGEHWNSSSTCKSIYRATVGFCLVFMRNHQIASWMDSFKWSSLTGLMSQNQRELLSLKISDYLHTLAFICCYFSILRKLVCDTWKLLNTVLKIFYMFITFFI